MNEELDEPNYNIGLAYQMGEVDSRFITIIERD